MLYDSYAADKLGLIVIDEQHKFGVLQRLALSRKGQNPDILVMTATPIPRTLGMIALRRPRLSVLDELPPGRVPIATRRVDGERAQEVWDFVRKLVAKGRQAYIVYPVIEGATEDQPELDFSHDEPEESRNQPPSPHGRQLAPAPARARPRHFFRAQLSKRRTANPARSRLEIGD